MPRPRIRRRVASGLVGHVFRPHRPPRQADRAARLTLDGLEALRLADLEGLYHEEAARRMGVSRATFARVLSGARRTVAGALVEGAVVEVGGGPIERRPSHGWPCPIHGTDRRKGRGCHCEREDAARPEPARRRDDGGRAE